MPSPCSFRGQVRDAAGTHQRRSCRPRQREGGAREDGAREGEGEGTGGEEGGTGEGTPQGRGTWGSARRPRCE